MADHSFEVRDLCKAYRIGVREEQSDTLVGALWSGIRAPIKNLRRLRSLNTYSVNGDSSDIVWALRDISFNVTAGEVVGIIGRNGAGKSTLLKVLSRITDPTSGSVQVRGRVSSLLEVGTGFHPELSGRENVYMNGTILGMSKREIDSKYDEIVAFSGVEKFLETPVKRYSSGMKVRLAFAVAAHLEPDILIIDEVLAVGDAEFQRKCLGKMDDVAGSGRTVLFVSHNMAAVDNLCPRSILLDGGKVVVDSDTSTVIRDYLHSADVGFGAVDLQTEGLTRNGSGEAQFSHVTVTDLRGNIANTVSMGDGISFLMDIQSAEGVENVLVGVTIFDLRGHRVCAMNSGDTASQAFDIPANQTKQVRCTIPNMNLMAGNYRVNLFIQQSGSRDMVDRVEQAAEFEVEPADIYETGKIPVGQAMVFLPVNWN